MPVFQHWHQHAPMGMLGGHGHAAMLSLTSSKDSLPVNDCLKPLSMAVRYWLPKKCKIPVETVVSRRMDDHSHIAKVT